MPDVTMRELREAAKAAGCRIDYWSEGNWGKVTAHAVLKSREINEDTELIDLTWERAKSWPLTRNAAKRVLLAALKELAKIKQEGK